MTLAQQYYEEGYEEGRQIGLKEGRMLVEQFVVILALETRFQWVPEDISDEIGRIADPERLHALLRSAIQSASLEDFTRSL